MADKIQRNVRLSLLTDARLKKYLESTGYSLAEVVDQAIREHLDRQQPLLEKYLAEQEKEQRPGNFPKGIA